jgi:hypothetical protein
MYPLISCHAFDGTIDNLPFNSNSRIIFHKENLGYDQDLHEYMKDYKDIFLKIDIEGYEHIILPRIINNGTINNIKQLVLEFHAPISYKRYENYFKGLEGIDNDLMFEIINYLNKTHKLVHIHVNNSPNHTFFEKDGIKCPELFECTFVRHDCELVLNKHKIPSIEFDMPNSSNLPDIELNYYPFFDWISDITSHSCKIYSSQDGQDGILQYIFKNIGTTNKFFVEFGFNVNNYYPGCGANTGLLKQQGWNGVLFDIENENKDINLFKEIITSENVVEIFEKYEVPKDVDYVSIDIDSIDLWVFRSIISSNIYKPRLITVEFNSNIDVSKD